MLMDTDEITSRIKNGEHIVFVKYGDGEILCMLGAHGENCDGDRYTDSLRNGLIRSLRFYSDKREENIFVGKWPHESSDGGNVFINSVLQKYNIPSPKFARYHLLINYDCVNSNMKVFDNPKMFNFVKSIQETSRKKIIFSNDKNIKLKKLFRADTYITIPSKNWFCDYNVYFEKVKTEITDGCILFTAGGQGSKVLIADLLTIFPKLTCLDIGSSFDLLCQKMQTRFNPGGAYDYPYDYQLNYYKDLMPADW